MIFAFVWLTLLSIIISASIHAAANGIIPFLPLSNHLMFTELLDGNPGTLLCASNSVEQKVQFLFHKVII